MDVEGFLRHELKPARAVKRVCRALLQGYQANGQETVARLKLEGLDTPAANALPLISALDVEVVEVVVVAPLADDNAACGPPSNADESRIPGNVSSKKSVSCTLRIKASKDLEAGPHHRDTQIRKRPGIEITCSAKIEGHGVCRSISHLPTLLILDDGSVFTCHCPQPNRQQAQTP